MQRRDFMALSGPAAAGAFLSSARQETIVHHYWDIARQLAETVSALAPEQSTTVAESFADALARSAAAALANLPEEARAALEDARSIGADLWGNVMEHAVSIGIDAFEEYRTGTMAWLFEAIDTWQTTGELPTFQVDRDTARCFFADLREQNYCAETAERTIVFCGSIGLMGLVAGVPGFLTVFGACARSRAASIALRAVLQCVAPAAGRCFI